MTNVTFYQAQSKRSNALSKRSNETYQVNRNLTKRSLGATLSKKQLAILEAQQENLRMAMQTVPITIVSKKFSKFVNTPEMDEKIDQLRI